MAFGPGKYDDLCTEVRKKAKAKGAIIFVVGGSKGDGMSCQADAVTTAALPEILEWVANQIRAGLE